jgi:transposase-like protein
VPGVPGRVPMARGVSLPALRTGGGLRVASAAAVAVQGVGRQVSVTAATVWHRTRLPLTVWFWAAYLVTTHTPGLSAVQLQRQLGISYETAWALLHKLRRAMVNPERELLTEKVEVDETYLGGHEAGRKGGRQLLDKALIVGAVEVRGKAAGRVRLKVVPDASGRSLAGFVKRTVTPGALVLTDAWQGYASLAALGYRHRSRTQGPPERAAQLLPHVHRVFGNLKTWLGGTHHGVGHDHLQAYLDEFAFRFNRRRTPMAAFQTSSASPRVLTAPRPTTCCIVRSQPDKQDMGLRAIDVGDELRILCRCHRGPPPP